MTPLEENHIKATIDHIRVQGDHMRAEQDKWRAQVRQETVRLILYGILIAAAWGAAAAALWEHIRPT